MKRWLSGPVEVPYLAGGYVLRCDGYRNFGYVNADLSRVETLEREFARRFLQSSRPASVWDIGANVGFWTLWLAAHVDARCRVRAFEPDARNLVYLRENVSRNGLSNVEIRECALSSTIGAMTLVLDETGAMNSLQADGVSDGAIRSGSTEVPVTTLDEEMASAGVPDFAKIDVEGHELAVLQGARSLLAQRRTVILLEVTRGGQETMDLLRSAGYVVQGLDGHELERPEYYVVASPTKLDRALFADR
jgi:FkbM family methyltransferase